MSRQEKTILTVFALALVLSLLALLLWQETGSDEPEILHLSVLLDGFEAAYRNLVHVRSCFSNRCNVQYVPSRATTPRS